MLDACEELTRLRLGFCAGTGAFAAHPIPIRMTDRRAVIPSALLIDRLIFIGSVEASRAVLCSDGGWGVDGCVRACVCVCGCRVKYPNMYADKKDNKDADAFNCVQRAHQNTLENMPHFIMFLLLAGLQVSSLPHLTPLSQPCPSYAVKVAQRSQRSQHANDASRLRGCTQSRLRGS
jgi:hypothetical protein